MEQGSVWQSVILSKYGRAPNGWECSSQVSPFMSLLWRGIIRLIPLFLPFIRFVVGNGKSLKFCKDHWWGDQCLSSSHPKLFRISNQKGALISDIVFPSLFGHRWNLTFSRDLYDWEVDMLAPIILNLEEFFIAQNEDKRIWILESSGKFSCKSFFKALIPFHNFEPQFPAIKIWKSQAPPRVKDFL